MGCMNVRVTKLLHLFCNGTYLKFIMAENLTKIQMIDGYSQLIERQ